MFVPRAVLLRKGKPAPGRAQQPAQACAPVVRRSQTAPPKPDRPTSTQAPSRQNKHSHGSAAGEGNEDGNEGKKEEEDDDEESSGGVVETSGEQRAALPGEPVCCVCGKYGEYVCDQTEMDVCSRECKETNLRQRRPDTTPASALVPAPPPTQPVARARPITPSEAFPDHSDDDDEQCQATGQVVFDLYAPHPFVRNLTQLQVQEIRRGIEVSIRGRDVGAPIVEFAHLGLPARLAANLAKLHYDKPSPVQMQALPLALSGRDVLCCAPTGSGKTAAFLIPCIVHCHRNRMRVPRPGMPMGLVLCPTRELCVQIESQAKQLARDMSLRTALVVGGLPLPPQLHRITKGCELVVATPGRLLDCLRRVEQKGGGASPEAARTSVVGAVHFVVLDEVDTMLQLGFGAQVDALMEYLPLPRQTLMFSATLPESVEQLAPSYLNDEVFMAVGNPGSTAETVRQVVVWAEDNQKKGKLFDLLNSPNHFHPPCVVFVASRVGADLLAAAITKKTQAPVGVVHGDMAQAERLSAVKRFVDGEFDMVVATNVLGRGLDLMRVSQVICFDMPQNIHEYVHQVGRAGRLGTPGHAVAFVNNNDKRLFPGLLRLLRSQPKLRHVIPSALENSPFAKERVRLRSHNAGRKRKRSQVDNNDDDDDQ